MVADAGEGPVERFDLEDDRDLARLADRADTPARFLILGSASPELLRQSSESLAGRIAFRDLGGFALDEVQDPERDRLDVVHAGEGTFEMEERIRAVAVGDLAE